MGLGAMALPIRGAAPGHLFFRRAITDFDVQFLWMSICHELLMLDFDDGLYRAVWMMVFYIICPGHVRGPAVFVEGFPGGPRERARKGPCPKASGRA